MKILHLSEYRKRLCFWDDMLSKAIDRHKKQEIIDYIIKRVSILTKEAYDDYDYYCFYKNKQK